MAGTTTQTRRSTLGTLPAILSKPTNGSAVWLRPLALMILVTLLTTGVAAGSRMWCGHLTSYGDWATTIRVFGGDTQALLEFTYYDGTGAEVDSRQWLLEPYAWYETTPDLEGSFRVESADNLVVMVSYRYGVTQSVCEFFLTESEHDEWILPNAVRPWMEYTGVAVVNPHDHAIELHLEAYQDGNQVGNSGTITLGPREKYSRLSDQIWPGIGYNDFEAVFVWATDVIPPPINITGNSAQDRHLFFTATRPDAWGKGASGGGTLTPAAIDTWCTHVTAAGEWRTQVDLMNMSGGSASIITYYRYDETGTGVGSGVTTVNYLNYHWVSLPSSLLEHEGSIHLLSSLDHLVKLSYQYGVTPSVCEFFLTGARETAWVLPNSAKSWMDYTGVAVVNPTNDPVDITLEAWDSGNPVGAAVTETLPPFGKYVRLADGVWSGLDIDEFDTILIRAETPIPAPISITGNNAQDRHLFFAARPEPMNTSGTALGSDPIVGAMRYVNAWEEYQGSPTSEACRQGSEARFDHFRSVNFAAMETEVTRPMWTALRAAQPSLPADPSHNFGIQIGDYPVQQVEWRLAVLFANLLSVQNGLEPCYYKDFLYIIPVDATNYTSGAILCAFNRTGYRLPTEGEWEFMCRAGTTTPFSLFEPAYNAGTCSLTTAGAFPQLENAAFFGANSSARTHLVALKSPNPWHLYDVHGNVAEWCWDYYAAYPSGGMTDYRGPASGTHRVVRGGSWESSASFLRSATRLYYVEAGSSSNIGFRLVRTMP